MQLVALRLPIDVLFAFFAICGCLLMEFLSNERARFCFQYLQP